MPPVLTKLPPDQELLKQKFLNFLSNRESELANAVACSRAMQKQLETFDCIKESLARSLNVATSKIHFFGSRVMGLANAESDLDIYVEMEDSFYRGLDKEKQQLYLDDFKVKLRSNRDWIVGIEIRDATVPILNLVYELLDIKCEISVCDGLGVATSKLMAHLFDTQPRAVEFFHFIRKWLICADFEFKGFQLAVLVLFYLQTRVLIPRMPLVHKKVPIVKIKGWKIQFDANRKYKGNPWMRFKRLAVRFFKYYLKFNYDQHVIFPHFGVPVPKTDYAFLKTMRKFPEGLKNFKADLPMAIAAPLACDYNITQDVSAKKLEKFKQICEFSLLVLRPVRKF